MASVFSHPALPVTLYYVLKKKFSKRLLWYSTFLTLAPDLDVIAFRFGIPYHSQWGHRGFTHSITFALVVALISILFSRQLKASRKWVFTLSFLSLLSHALLDALTNGGLGVALFWPISDERFFFPFRPVLVSPIGIWGFLSLRGILVVLSEILWIWTPFLLTSYFVRKFSTRHT